MNLLLASLIALLVWLFVAKLLIPSFQTMNFRNSKFAELTKVGWIAALVYIRKFALIATIVYASLWLFLKIMNGLAYVFNGSDGIVSGVFSLLSSISHSLDNISNNKSIWVLIILSLIFLVIITRNARRHALSVYNNLYKDYEAGKIPVLAPSAEMTALNEKIANTEQEFINITFIPSGDLSPQDRVKKDFYLEVLSKAIPVMKSNLKELDIRRRILPELEKESVHDERSGWKEKFLTFFTSKGLVRSVYNTSRTIGTIGLIFILLSFLAAAKTIIINDTNIVSTKIVNLQLQRQQQEIDKKWQDALAQQVPDSPNDKDEWDDEDEQTLDEISHQFEIAIANSFTGKPQEVSAITRFRLKANAVKENVIRTFATNKDGSIKTGYEVVEQGSRLTTDDPEIKFSKKYSNEYARNVKSNSPTTNIGKQFREGLKEKVQSNKGVWKKIKTNYQASLSSFSKPATAKEVLGMILGESFQEAVSGTLNLADPGNIEAKLLKDFVERTGNKTAKAWMEVKMNQFTDDLVYRKFDDAVGNVSKAKTPAEKFVSYAVKDLDFPPVESIASNLSEHPPCLDYQSLNENQIKQSKSAIKDFSAVSGKKPALYADAVSDFKYHFPGQPGMEMESAASDIGGGGGGGGGGGDIRNSQRSSTKPRIKPGGGGGNIATNIPAGRARSFSTLRGFRRIGGVLIGQDPSNTGNTGVAFNNITWKDLGDQMEIFLHRADGKVISAGIYDKDIIHQALAYVSDGRLITVTMVSAKPLPFLKILAHPTLVNTDLGCKAIGLDRFVDKYARDDSRVDKALRSFDYQNLLYRYACLRIVANKSFNYAEELSEYLEKMETEIVTYWDEIYITLDGGKVFNDPNTSHIASKPKYFSSEILSALIAALNESDGDVDEFISALKTKTGFGSLDSYLKAETEEWSGVRELPYSVDQELTFLRPAGNQNPNLFPLSFIRQIVFNPTDFNSGYTEVTEQIDEDPWEFPMLKKEGIIEKLVWKGIERNSVDEEILNRMKSFALMQRLFRVIMNGDLGLDFPVEKLSELAGQTHSYIQTIATPTWNSSGLTLDRILSILRLSYSEEEVEKYKLLWISQDIEAEKNRRPCN